MLVNDADWELVVSCNMIDYIFLTCYDLKSLGSSGKTAVFVSSHTQYLVPWESGDSLEQDDT